MGLRNGPGRAGARGDIRAYVWVGGGWVAAVKVNITGGTKRAGGTCEGGQFIVHMCVTCAVSSREHIPVFPGFASYFFNFIPK